MRLYILLVALVCSAVVALSPMPASAELQVLLKTGDVAPDGRIFSAFSGTNAPSATKAAFLGTTSAIVKKSGASFNVVVKTGDPLPIPLVGTFDSFADPVINDAGNMAFRATSLNSTSAESGLFYCCDGGVIVPISLRGGTAGGVVSVTRAPDINNNGDVVFKNGNGDIYLWDHASQTTVGIALVSQASPGGGTFRAFGDRPVLNDNKEVAFEGEVSGGPDGIFLASPFLFPFVSSVALEGAASPIPGGTYAATTPSGAVAINAFGEVAWVSNVVLPGPDRTGVFIGYPSTPTVLVAKETDLIGVTTLAAIDDEFVGIDSSDNVAFEGIAGTRQLIIGNGGPLSSLAALTTSVSDFEPRLTSTHGVVWRRGGVAIDRLDGVTSTVATVVTTGDVTPLGLGTFPRDPSINVADDVAFLAFQSALYTLNHGVVARVAGPGDPSLNGGTLKTVDAFAYRGSSLAFSAYETTGNALITLKRGAGAGNVVRDGDAAPGGGTFVLDTLMLDVRGSKVVFKSSIDSGTALGGLFRVNGSNGRVDTVVLDNDPSPIVGTFFNTFLSVRATGNDVTFVADLDTGARGVFVKNNSGVITVALEGDVLPDTGGGTLASFSNVAASSNRVAFIATVDNGTVPNGLFLWDHGQTRRILSEGDAAGIPGVTFGSIDSGSIDNGDGPPLTNSNSITFVAPINGGTASQAVFYIRKNGSPQGVVFSDTPTSIGGVVTDLSFVGPLSRVGNSVVFDGGLSAPSGVAGALLRAKP